MDIVVSWIEYCYLGGLDILTYEEEIAFHVDTF